LADSITGAGGIILPGCEVININAYGDKAASVTLKDSRIIEAENFISDIHPASTMKMINGSGAGRLYRERIYGLENTVSVFMMYITFKKEKVKPIGHNCYIYSDENVCGTVNYEKNSWPQSCIVRFPGQEKNNIYQESANVVAYMKYEEVKKWEHTQAGNRGAEYSDFKERKAGQLLSFIEKKWPGFKDNIKACKAATPLTLSGYTGTKNGSIYGLLKSSKDPVGSLVPPKTKISNLYLTGQNIFLHGLLGVTISSVLTCSELLGYEYLVNKIKKS
jgi:all-trans-retinol 13,14-reductase